MQKFRGFTALTAKMIELLGEPARVYSDNAVDRTEEESATFLWDTSDLASGVVFKRTVEYDAGNLKVSSTAWALDNGIEITDVTTDATNDSVIPKDSLTTLTISGSGFKGEVSDYKVLVWVLPAGAAGATGPMFPSRGKPGIPCEATITSISNDDDEVIATVSLPNLYGGKNARKGPCTVEVIDIRRNLTTEEWVGLTVV